MRVVPEGEDPVERLNPFASSPPAPAPPPTVSRRWALIGGIVMVLALIAISIPVLTSGGGAGVDIGANSVARMDPADGTVELAEELGQRPGASVVGFGSLWVAQPDRGVVTPTLTPRCPSDASDTEIDIAWLANFPYSR
ncbi:MAG TPA: hypothetical protein VGL16_08760 [Actinomycetota bacterium]